MQLQTPVSLLLAEKLVEDPLSAALKMPQGICLELKYMKKVKASCATQGVA